MTDDVLPPKIILWYGKHQVFGHTGLPQKWVNILGRVQSTHTVRKLQYSLNETNYKDLSIGPDQRRLVGVGDFNIDIDSRHLRLGDNQIIIVATDEKGQSTTQDLVVKYRKTSQPLPYCIEWDKQPNIQDAAQPIDGLWTMSKGKVSPYEIGYDRLLALGDMTWKDYEVVVPITIHGINAACYQYPSIHAGVGVVLRWKGHSDWGSDPYASAQPAFGPGPYGAISWYCIFHDKGGLLNFFDPDFNMMKQKPYTLELHTEYIFKTRVKKSETGESQYCLKVWKAGQTEPLVWDITAIGHPAALKEGSCMLVAHHVAASFGKVTINSLEGGAN